MISDELIEVASNLLHSSSGRPSRAALDRAVSTAYYALFHALCHLCVDRLVGWRNRSSKYWESVTPVYRLIDHGAAKRVLLQYAGSKATPPELRRLAAVFIELQADRLLADYDPQPRFDVGDARHRIDLAAHAIADLRSLSADDRRLLAIQLITKPR
jgi:hypothetical protein